MFNTMVNITKEMQDLEDWMIWKNELWFSDIIKRLNENGNFSLYRGKLYTSKSF